MSVSALVKPVIVTAERRRRRDASQNDWSDREHNRKGTGRQPLPQRRQGV
jgi:hypothetical protein